MNLSSANTSLVASQRDSFSKAVAKNVIVVALGISITFINASLIFNTNPRYILFIHMKTLVLKNVMGSVARVVNRSRKMENVLVAQISAMHSSANISLVASQRDSFSKAVAKNVIVVALGISITFINASLVHTFHKHQIFNTNPRYILFIHMVINDTLQLTLTILLFLLSYTLYHINVSLCSFIIMLALFTTENTPLNLACMALECYVAVCLPLHHARICTVRRTYLCIALIWATSTFSIFPDLFTTLATEPITFFSTRVFCLRETVFRSPHIIRKRDVYYVLLLVVIWLTLLYTYFHILFTARTASVDAKKARNTILLHGFQLLLCMLVYVAPWLKTLLNYWFPKSLADSLFACYIIINILPRSISPVVYGLRDKTFRMYLKKHLMRRLTLVTVALKPS
ncbi:hypothetical protein CRUP_012702 [Coryphaenoides rupestris]|nr:hypothetical protein CRUP_012702 [Coryphaenoides rupestris]